MKAVFLLFLLGGPLAAEPLSLSEAVRRSLAASPALAQARAAADEADAALSQARLASLPRLGAKALATRGDDPVYVFGSLLEQRRFGPQNFAISSLNDPGYLTNVKSSLELGVPLFTGFALSDGRELGRIQGGAARAAADAASQQARWRAVETYLTDLRARAQMADADERVTAAEAELEEARRLRARGLVLGSDFYAAQALLSSLRARRIEAAHEEAGAREALAELLGGAAGEPEGSLEDPSYSTAPVAELLADAAARRGDLKQAAAGVSAAAVLARRERRSVLPSVDAFASIETNTDDFSSNPVNKLLGVRASLPFGDPTYLARGRRADEARTAAEAARAAAEQGARLEVRRLWEEYAAAAETLPVARDSVEQARRSLELFRPLYREGRQSILDVLRAEAALLDARAAYQRTLFAAHAGYARLRLASGSLDDAAVAEIERRLGGAR